MAKVTALTEIHRGGEHLVSCTFEVDITQAERLIAGFDVSGIPDAQLDQLIELGEQVRKARQVEDDAHAAAAQVGNDENTTTK